MFNTTIVLVTLFSVIILAFPLILSKGSNSPKINNIFEAFSLRDKVELYSFEIKNECSGWSFIIDTPPLTSEVIDECPIFFYIELEDGYQKLPYKDLKSGFKVSVYKREKRIYLTCKSLVDNVSNYHLPSNFLKTIKILVINANKEKEYSKWGCKFKKAILHKKLENAGVDVGNYNDVLGHFTEASYLLQFKGHFRKQHSTN